MSTAGGIELHDIQGIVTRAYSELSAARYALFRFGSGTDGRRWVSGIAERAYRADQGAARARALNVALTWAGLQALDVQRWLDPQHPFSLEFEGGMTTQHRRRILGDEGGSAPERWSWGGPEAEAHALVMLFACDSEELDRLSVEERKHATQHRLTEVALLETCQLPDRKEHFGFRDGVAQPVMAGLGKRIPAGQESATASVFEMGGSFANVLAAGEFVLGYPNVYGKLPSSPRVVARSDGANHLSESSDGFRDLGRNGTYLVMRQLRQLVHTFWSRLDELTRAPDGTPDDVARDRLAAKMVGRWRDGSPIVLAPDGPVPGLADRDDFGYYERDRHGMRCPIGAHIRRTNPRDGLEPELGEPGRAAADASKHRLLRRGRAFGPPVHPDLTPEGILAAGRAADEVPRGLHFICLNANIARQFEFVQHTWANNPKFGGLYRETDPLIGVTNEQTTARGITGDFTVPNTIRERYQGLPRFVEVMGGAYFFLPSLSALRYVGALEPA